MIPTYAVGPALLYVACCMMKHLGELHLEDISETAPCMITIMLIPFTFLLQTELAAESSFIPC